MIVAGLMAIAVLVPLGAWWISGSRQAAQDARAGAQQAAAEAQTAADEAARRLADRLLTLRAVENTRPFYHYRNLYHEPRGATRGLSIIPSPLSEGAQNPLVAVYFQIEASGDITLPTVNEQFPELSTEEGYATYCAFLEEMQTSLVMNAEGAPILATRNLELDALAWQQIEAANEVYAELTGKESTGADIDHGDRVAATPVMIRIGALRWHTILTSSGPMLAALRQVETPSGVLVQGFTIAAGAAASEASGIRLVFTPEVANHDLKVAAPVADTGWLLEGAIDATMLRAEQGSAALIGSFHRQFAFGALAAVLAALSVMVMVVQTDRLARQRTRFAAVAAHELKTPLAALRLYGDMLAQGLGDPERRAAYAERIGDEAGRLGRVVANILDLSRLERGAQLVQPAATDLVPVVVACVEGLRRGFEIAGLEVVLRIEQPEIVAFFDADAVCQILGNLLDNAERYTRGVAGRRVDIVVASGAAQARVVVADNGPGVRGAKKRAIFKPFVRDQADDGPAGLGLGLALGRSLARAQGGDLRLDDSRESGGAVLVLSLPLV